MYEICVKFEIHVHEICMTSGHALRTSLLFIVFLQHFCRYFFIHFFIRVFIRVVIRVFIRVVIRVSVRRHGVNFVVETLRGATTTWGVLISVRYGHEVVFFSSLSSARAAGMTYHMSSMVPSSPHTLSIGTYYRHIF